MTQLGVAIIGCGSMGGFTRPGTRATLPKGWLPLSHAEAVSEVEGIRLLAACDPDPGARERFGRQYNVPTFSDVGEMLSGVKPDMATVATRAGPRADAIYKCVEAGIRGIHAEKPLCRSLGDASRICEALERADVSFTYGALRRYHAAYRAAAKHVAAGEIGNLRQVVVGFGRRTAMWTHTHSIDALLFFAGSPGAAYVQASIDSKARIVGGANGSLVLDDDPTIELGYVAFRNGVTGLISQIDGFDVILAGTAGTLRIAADGSRLILEALRPDSGGYHVDTREIAVSTDQSGTMTAISELRDAVATGLSNRVALGAAVEGQRLLFAMILSGFRNGERVDPAEVPDELVVTGRSGDLYA